MATTPTTNPEAYDEGRSAARAGRSLGDNPHWYDCIPKAVAWEDGWFSVNCKYDHPNNPNEPDKTEDRPA